AASGGEPQNKARRGAAEKIVARYRLYAALGGLVPMPALNVAGVTAINLRMVKALSDLYGVPFERDRARTAIVALIGGSVPTGLGSAPGSRVGLVIRVGALAARAVPSLSAAPLPRGIGAVFIELSKSGGVPAGPMPPAASDNSA